jgi:uncharacterized repeat protein (TIGR01451 family)
MQDPAPEMVKTVSKPVVAVGEEFTFTITLRNGGNGDLVNAQLTDPMPPKMRALAVDNPACVLGAKGASVSCDFGTVQPGAARVVTITAVASTDGGYTNVATLTSTNIPPLVTRVPGTITVSAGAVYSWAYVVAIFWCVLATNVLCGRPLLASTNLKLI